jgi:DNA replication protein DnaC
MIKAGKSFFIHGDSDSEKTHLAAYLFLKLLKELPLVPEREFVWASLLDIHERVISDISNEHYVLNEFRIPKYLFLHFGEYSGELGSDDTVTRAAQRFMFKISEFRTERSDKVDVYVSTNDIRKMFLIFGNEIGGRIVEKCHEISLPKKGHRLQMFKERPKITGSKVED